VEKRGEGRELIAGRYRLQEVVGRGGMGEVWQASDEVLGRPVALKLLLSRPGDDTALGRFRLEAQTAARLSHRNVVAVYDFGTDQGRLYLVMELIDGRSLADELADHGPLPPQQVAAIGAGVATGLAVAHREGVIHRDIKPANLLLPSDGTVKIGDFGLARFADESVAGLTVTGQVMGTTAYLAPERGLGHPAGPASDVYALGCVLYQLLTGRPPFQADTAAAVVYQHVETSPRPIRGYRPDLPEPFDAYVLTMLSKDPERRPTAQQAAGAFAAARTAWVPPPPAAAGTSAPLPGAQDTPRQPHIASSARPAGTRQPDGGRKVTRRSVVTIGTVAAAAITAVTVATLVAASGNDGKESHPKPAAVQSTPASPPSSPPVPSTSRVSRTTEPPAPARTTAAGPAGKPGHSAKAPVHPAEDPAHSDEGPAKAHGPATNKKGTPPGLAKKAVAPPQHH
jgi:serine/threonine protein kinase